MENELTISKQNMVSLITDNRLGDLIKPLKHEILMFTSYIAGTMHIEDETVFDGVHEGDTLILQREPENKFDENAILVLNANRQKLGYVPEKDNIVFTRLMDAGKFLTAKVDYMSDRRSFKQIDISIYLVDF